MARDEALIVDDDRVEEKILRPGDVISYALDLMRSAGRALAR